MCMGFNHWFRSLILFFPLSLSAMANPYLALSSGIAESLAAAGIPQAQAVSDADSIISKRFGHNRTLGTDSSSFSSYNSFGKNSSSNSSTVAVPKEKSVIQDLFSEGVKKSFELRNGSGDRGIIYDVVENGNQADMDKLKKYYQDYNITFKHGVTPRETYKLTELFTSETFKEIGRGNLPNNLEVTIAPLWYEQMGMSVYRTESPIIRRNGIGYYLFFDTLYDLYDSGFGYGLLKFPHVESVTANLGKRSDGTDVLFEIYRETPDIYSDEADADLSAELIYSNIYRFTYAFERHIRDYSANFEDDLAYMKTDECTNGDLDCIYLGLTNNADLSSTFIEEGRGEINIAKPDPNITEPENKITESDDFDESEKVEIHENFDGAVADGESKSVFGNDYKVTDESMAAAANEIIKQVKDGEIEGLSEESKSVINQEDFKVTPTNFSGSSSSGGSVSANDLAKSAKSSFSEFDKVVATRSGGKINAPARLHEKGSGSSATDNKPPVADTNAGEASANSTETENPTRTGLNTASTSGSKSDTNIGGSSGAIGGASTGTGITSGSGVSSGATSSAGSFSSSTSKANTANATATAEKTEKDKENEDALDFPILEDFDVLKPLRDWRESLLTKVQGVSISGTCPSFSIEAFGTTISTNAHCDIFESIKGVLTAVMSIVWAFIAFRIVFEA